MKLFLLGFMGSGKSSLAKKLAKKLQLTFLDLDKEIEKKKGCSISEIFSKDGEVAFRKLENEQLKELIQKQSNFVMACGGGTVCFYDNMSLINNSGSSIFLDVDEKILFGRLKEAKDERPLIKSLSETELKTFVHEKLKERRPFYESADLIIRDNNIKLSQLIQIIESLQKD